MPLDSCLKDGNMEKDLQTVAICNSKKKKKKAQHTKEKTKMITKNRNVLELCIANV